MSVVSSHVTHVKSADTLCSSAPNMQSNICFSVFVCSLCRLYHITLWTFLLALGHFLSELFIFGTAAPTVGVLAPLMVASKHGATLDPCSGDPCSGDPCSSGGAGVEHRCAGLAGCSFYVYHWSFLCLEGLSILGMLIGLRYLEAEPVSRQKKRNWNWGQPCHLQNAIIFHLRCLRSSSSVLRSCLFSCDIISFFWVQHLKPLRFFFLMFLTF